MTGFSLAISETAKKHTNKQIFLNIEVTPLFLGEEVSIIKNSRERTLVLGEYSNEPVYASHLREQRPDRLGRPL